MPVSSNKLYNFGSFEVYKKVVYADTVVKYYANCRLITASDLAVIG